MSTRRSSCSTRDDLKPGSDNNVQFEREKERKTAFLKCEAAKREKNGG
jgi:hypothetical protein